MEKGEVKSNGQKQYAKDDEIKYKFIALSDNDPTLEEDNEEGIYGHLRTQLGKTNLELHKIIAML